jgi:excisionase family DNA binding protein
MDGNGRRRTLRVEEVCEWLQISDSLAYDLIQAGELEAFRCGFGKQRGGLRVLVDSVDAFVSRRCEQYGEERLGLKIVSTVPIVPTVPVKPLRVGKKRERI